MNRIKEMKLFLFDMDGTLYLGDRLYPFTKELLQTIREKGGKYLFMTNNSSKSVEDYIIAVSTFKPKYNADFYASEDDDDYYSSSVDSVENNLDTERIYFKLCQQEKLIYALAELKKPERLLIEYVYGICPKCLKNKEKKTLREASLLLGLTEDGAGKKLKKILEKLRKTPQK